MQQSGDSTKVQPASASQPSSVQGSPSSQGIGDPPTHAPAWQTWLVLQTVESQVVPTGSATVTHCPAPGLQAQRWQTGATPRASQSRSTMHSGTGGCTISSGASAAPEPSAAGVLPSRAASSASVPSQAWVSVGPRSDAPPADASATASPVGRPVGKPVVASVVGKLVATPLPPSVGTEVEASPPQATPRSPASDSAIIHVITGRPSELAAACFEGVGMNRPCR